MTIKSKINLPKGIFITGTDTGVGKTVVTAALASLLKSNGNKINVIKPFQTGTDLPGLNDIEFIYKVLDEPYDLDEVCPYRLSKPLAPLSAAALESVDLNLTNVKSLIQDCLNKYEVTIVEGAGGIFVPIKQNYFMSDLAGELGLKLLVVSKPNLGTINHTLLTLEHARLKGLEILGVVICNYPENPGLAEITSLPLIERLGNVPLVGLIPYIQNLNVEKGSLGNLPMKVSDYFVSELGGNLDFKKIIKQKFF